MPTPLAGTPVAAPITEAVAKRVKRRPEADEPLPKRCATSCEGKILEIGTPKRFVKLYIHKKMLTIEGDQYLTAYSDKLTELKSMTIWKKNVQGFPGTASKWASTRFISCPTDIPGATRSICSNWVRTNFMSYPTDIPGATRLIYSKWVSTNFVTCHTDIPGAIRPIYAKWVSTSFMNYQTDIPGATRPYCSKWVSTNFVSYPTDIPAATRPVYSKWESTNFMIYPTDIPGATFKEQSGAIKQKWSGRA